MTFVIALGVLFGLFSIALMLKPLATNTLVLGSGVDAMHLLRDIEANSSMARHGLLGFVGTNERESLIPRKFRIEGKDNLLQLVTDLKVKRLVIALEPEDLNDWAQQLLNCKLRGVKLVDSSALKSHPKAIRTPYHDKGRVLQLPLVR